MRFVQKQLLEFEKEAASLNLLRNAAELRCVLWKINFWSLKRKRYTYFVGKWRRAQMHFEEKQLLEFEKGASALNLVRIGAGLRCVL